MKYGADVYIHKNELGPGGHFTIGRAAEFAVLTNNRGQPQANAVKWLGMAPNWTPNSPSSGGAAGYAGCAGAPVSTSSSAEQPRPPPPQPQQQQLQELNQPHPGRRYLGVLKSFSAAKGYGFISQPELFAEYKRDVYLDKSQLPRQERWALEQPVSFECTLNAKGMPQAQKLDWNPVRDQDGHLAPNSAQTAAESGGAVADEAEESAGAPTTPAAPMQRQARKPMPLKNMPLVVASSSNASGGRQEQAAPQAAGGKAAGDASGGAPSKPPGFQEVDLQISDDAGEGLGSNRELLQLIETDQAEPAVVKAIELQSSGQQEDGGQNVGDYMGFVISRLGVKRVIEGCSEFVKMLSVLLISKHLKNAPPNTIPQKLDWLLQLSQATDVTEEQAVPHALGVLQQVHVHLEAVEQSSSPVQEAPLLLEELRHLKTVIAELMERVPSNSAETGAA